MILSELNVKNQNNNNKNLITIYNNNNTTTNYEITKTMNSNNINEGKITSMKYNKVNSNNKKKKRICRICYSEDDDLDNPLIQPCNCSGTMKYIHIDCLKKWISTRSCVEVENNNECCVYIIKQVECELCKCKLPDYVNHKGKLFEIIHFNCDYKIYIIVESLTIDKHKNKFLYIVNLENKNIINVGRGRNSDLLLSDISVSRLHCKITKERNKVFIYDNNSKFGTLILLQNQLLRIHPNLSLYLQIGRSYFEIFMKKHFSCFNCCETLENEDVFYYQKQNEKSIKYEKNLIVKNDKHDDVEDSDNESEENIQIGNHGLKVVEVDKKSNSENNEDDDKGILLRSKNKNRFNRRSILPEVDNLLNLNTNLTNNKNK